MSTEIVKRFGSDWVEVRKVTLPPTSESQPEWEHQWEIYFMSEMAETHLGFFIFQTSTETPAHGDTVQANRKVAECVKMAEAL